MNKRVIADKPVTKAEMDRAFQEFRMGFKIELKTELRGEIEDLMIQFRSDIFTRLDEVMGKLEQIHEEQVFMRHDIKTLKTTDADHEKRIRELESR